MSETVTFVVDLDAAGAPPAADSVRQLLALIEGLQFQDEDLDWRLRAVSMNSPLRAELQGFDREGVPAPDMQAAAAAEAAFEVLDAINDNEPAKAIHGLSDTKRKRLRSLLLPLRDRTGSLKIIIEGHSERVVRSDQAQRALVLLTAPGRQRGPELGSIEGQILAATTHYNSPALRVRTFLTGDEVLCVFEKELAPKIGAAHTLDEVWSGQRVIVGGKITYDAAGAAHLLRATSLRVIREGAIRVADIAALTEGGRAVADDWGTAH